VAVEMAAGMRKRGLPVVAVTSASNGPWEGRARLVDHADIVIDICTPPGDALVRLPGVDEPLGPGSTLAYTAVVNELKVQTAALLAQRGVLPPVLTSAAVVGTERSRALFEAVYREHARRYARVLAGADDTGTDPDRRVGGRSPQGGAE
jgi:uncharacterized phosphosugar-binding protein